VIPGAEITRAAPYGHVNAVFIADANELVKVDRTISDSRRHSRASNEWPAQAAIDAAVAQGAFLFWNHSWTIADNLIPEVSAEQRDNIQAGKLHGIEVANGAIYSEAAFEIALEQNLVLIGTSDVHNLIDWDYQPHAGGHRPVTLVFAAESSLSGIRQALFSKRTVVWYKNLLIGRPEQLGPLLDASLKVSDVDWIARGHRVTVKLKNDSDADFRLRNLTTFRFLFDGDHIDVPAHAVTSIDVLLEENRDRLTLEFEVLNALVAPRRHPVIEFELTR
jgi:hypothetical protein